jgi:IclR family mhp operon transcriptional activator
MTMSKSIRSVERLIEILTFLNRRNGSNSNQVALGTSLSRGTAYRMLETLVHIGIVERKDGEGGGYWLTSKVRELSAGFDEESWISEIAGPEMARLCDSIVWPVMLTTPRGVDMLLRATTDAKTALVLIRHIVGHTVPMLGSAAGRCYLAFAPPAQREAILDLIGRTAPSPWNELAADRKSLSRMLNDIRDHGVATAESPEGGTVSLAAPIMIGDEPRAILGTRYFRRAMSVEIASQRLFSPLQRAAQDIGSMLLSRPQ